MGSSGANGRLGSIGSRRGGGPVKEEFYFETVRRLLDESWLLADHEVLVVAGGEADREVLVAAGATTVTISNLDERMQGDEFAPYRWSFQDAENLTYPDESFDVCVVHQGLHHCRSPHRALLEMYRVARFGIVVFEPQETLLTRLGVRLGIGQQYECAAVAGNDLRWGGVQNTAIPNFVYRWTEREVRKCLAANDPTGEPRIRCFFDLRVPGAVAHRMRTPSARAIARVAVPAARLALRFAPSQANAIAIVADKLDPSNDLHPWLEVDELGPRPDAAWFQGRQGASLGVVARTDGR
jgi:SAM-dependent methyltransferase